MKNIGIIVLDEKIDSGVYQYSLSLIESLSTDKQNTYTLFTHKDNSTFDHLNIKIVKVNVQINRLQKLLIFFFLALNIKKDFIFSKTLMLEFKGIDLFITPYISFFPHFFLNKDYIFVLHDMQEKYFPNFFTKKELFRRDIVNISLSKHAKYILCESDFVKNDIHIFLDIPNHKIHRIEAPPPNNFEQFIYTQEKAKIIKHKYSLPNKYIYYPAQFWPHKNHKKLLEALQLVLKEQKDLYLVLTGSQQNYFYDVMSYAEYLDIKENIVYLGYVDYDELPYLYKASQMLVMPSLYESISIPIFEAFSLGVPVCASNIVAIPQQVGDAGLLFDPNSSEEIANSILKCLDSDIQKKLSENGVKKIKEFDKMIFQKKVLELVYS